MNYGYKKDGTYVSPSSWWRNRLGDISDTFEVSSYEAKDTFSKQRFKLRRALHSLARTVNLVENSHASMDNPLTLAWGDGETINRPNSRQVTLDATRYLANAGNEEVELDVLTGQALTLSSMKRTMDMASFMFYEVTKRASTGNLSKVPMASRTAMPLFEANEYHKARKEVLDNWQGFSDYFKIYQEATVDGKASIEGILADAVNSPHAFAHIVGWNVLNPDNRVTFGDENLDRILSQAEKMTVSEPADPSEAAASFTHQLSVANFIIDNLEVIEEPPSDCSGDDESDDHGSDENQGDANGESEDTGTEGQDDSGGNATSGSDQKSSPNRFNNDWEPSSTLTDRNLFGKAAQFVSAGTEKLSLSDDSLKMDNPLNIFDYYPDKDVPLDSLGVVRVHHRSSAQYKKTVAEMSKAIQSIKNALAFRATKMTTLVHGYEDGDLDEGSFYKIAQNSPNIFSQRNAVSKPDIAITLLVDLSGSMGMSGKYADAQKVAISLTEALKEIKGVHLSVLGHTADVSATEYSSTIQNKFQDTKVDIIQEGSKVMISELYSKNHSNPYALSTIYHHDNNYDGYAIEYAAKAQIKNHPEAKQKIVVVLSDGRPCNGSSHVRESVENTRRKHGTQVYGIGVRDAYTEADGIEMYGAGYSVVLGDVLSTLPLLTRFLRSKLARL